MTEAEKIERDTKRLAVQSNVPEGLHPDIAQRFKAKAEADEARRQQRLEVARRQGLVLVEVSPRRSIIIQVSTISGGGYQGKLPFNEGRYMTYQTGSKVFGPADYNACLSWLSSHCEDVPDNLRHG